MGLVEGGEAGSLLGIDDSDWDGGLGQSGASRLQRGINSKHRHQGWTFLL